MLQALIFVVSIVVLLVAGVGFLKSFIIALIAAIVSPLITIPLFAGFLKDDE